MMSGGRGGADFAVDFGAIGVDDEGVKKSIGGVDGVDGVGCKKRGKPFLPVVMAALDFAFCLGRGRVAQSDAVEVESLAEPFRQAQGPEPAEGLRKGVGSVGEKERVIIDVESEREAVCEEAQGEEVEVSGEIFAGVDAGAGVETGGIVDDLEKGLFARVAGEPGVRSGVVLQERAEVADLPAAHGFGGLFVAGVRRELADDGPAADAGAIGFEGQAAKQFAGDGAVGGTGRGRKKACGESDGLRRPVWLMIAAGAAWLPGIGPALGTSAEVFGAELVDASQTEAEFGGEGGCRKLTRPQISEKVAD